jgi:hypothetical protein
MTILQSGVVGYDSENREVKLVRALVSEKPGNNPWAILKHDKSLAIANFGPGGTKYRKRPKKELLTLFSEHAEWGLSSQDRMGQDGIRFFSIRLGPARFFRNDRVFRGRS